jgi:hypothetical protein
MSVRRVRQTSVNHKQRIHSATCAEVAQTRKRDDTERYTFSTNIQTYQLDIQKHTYRTHTHTHTHTTSKQANKQTKPHHDTHTH